MTKAEEYIREKWFISICGHRVVEEEYALKAIKISILEERINMVKFKATQAIVIDKKLFEELITKKEQLESELNDLMK